MSLITTSLFWEESNFFSLLYFDNLIFGRLQTLQFSLLQQLLCIILIMSDAGTERNTVHAPFPLFTHLSLPLIWMDLSVSDSTRPISRLEQPRLQKRYRGIHFVRGIAQAHNIPRDAARTRNTYMPAATLTPPSRSHAQQLHV